MRALYYLSYAFGGPGFSMPMGLLLAGVCVPAAFMKLLPKWLVVFGLALAVCGELSWLNLVLAGRVVPHSTGEVPKLHLVDRCWIQAARRYCPRVAPSGGGSMKTVLGLIMIANAALFLFGAVQHIGAAIGPFHEPRIIPAAIVETICAIALLWGAAAVLGHMHGLWRVALITNLVALAGVLLGIVALAVGAGPRTAS